LLVHGTRYSNRLKIYNEHMARIQQLNQKEQQQQQQLNAQAGTQHIQQQQQLNAQAGTQEQQQNPVVGTAVCVYEPQNATQNATSLMMWPVSAVESSVSLVVSSVSSVVSSASSFVSSASSFVSSLPFDFEKFQYSFTNAGKLSAAICCADDMPFGCLITGPTMSGFPWIFGWDWSICNGDKRISYNADDVSLLNLAMYIWALSFVLFNFIKLASKIIQLVFWCELLEDTCMAARLLVAFNLGYLWWHIFEAHERNNFWIAAKEIVYDGVFNLLCIVFPVKGIGFTLFKSIGSFYLERRKEQRRRQKDVLDRLKLTSVKKLLNVLELEWLISIEDVCTAMSTGAQLAIPKLGGSRHSRATGTRAARGRTPVRGAAGEKCSKCKVEEARHTDLCCKCFYDAAPSSRKPAIHKNNTMCVKCANQADEKHRYCKGHSLCSLNTNVPNAADQVENAAELDPNAVEQ